MSKQIVEQVKAELVARGQKWETNEDSFEITGRVAWLKRGEGAMLISKNPGQNGANTKVGRVSHDAIAFPTGWKDVLISAGPELNVNGPAWDPTGSSSAALIAPYNLDLDAVMVAPAPPVVVPETPATPAVPSNIEVRLTAIETLLTRLVGILAADEADDPTYDVPYDINAGWPIGRQKGMLVMTPRKR